MKNIGFIGLGEVAESFISRFLEEKEITIYGYDKNNNKRIKKISMCESVKELLEKTSNIIIAIPGKNEEKLFEDIIKNNIKGYLFIDMCTNDPSSKIKISNILDNNSAKYVDVAIVGSVAKQSYKVPMLVSGNGTKKMMSLFSTFDFNIKSEGINPGKASTIKLCRSVFMKGLPALLAETKEVSNKYGVEKEVISSIYKDFENIEFSSYAELLIKSAKKHNLRQTQELSECVKMEKKIGAHCEMSKAALSTFKKILK